MSNTGQSVLRITCIYSSMIMRWFLAIADFSKYRCLACRAIIDTPASMAPLFKHLAKYHAGALADAIAGERAKTRAAAA